MISTRTYNNKLDSRASSLRKTHDKNSNSIKTTDSSIKVSLRRTKKSVECPKNTYQPKVQRPMIVPRAEKKEFLLSETLQRQRQRDLIQIKKSISLLKYYNCLLMLFMIIYTSSQITLTNFFSTKSRQCPEFGIRLLDTLMKVYHNIKQNQIDTKIKRLAVNIMKISPTVSEFQKKAEFISRKVTLNRDKRKEIEMALYNGQIQSFWSIISKQIFIDTQSEFISEIFESDAEKLCVKDFQGIIDNYLSTQLFEREESSILELFEPQKEKSHNFTVQFLLIEKICTKEYNSKVDIERGQKDVKFNQKMKKSCDIY